MCVFPFKILNRARTADQNLANKINPDVLLNCDDCVRNLLDPSAVICPLKTVPVITIYSKPAKNLILVLV